MQGNQLRDLKINSSQHRLTIDSHIEGRLNLSMIGQKKSPMMISWTTPSSCLMESQSASATCLMYNAVTVTWKNAITGNTKGTVIPRRGRDDN